jgi:hypothetical protein
MLEAIREFGQGGAALLLGLATGAAWMMAIVAPNVSYDRLDASRADGHIRHLMKSGSDPIAFILLAAGALAILGGAVAAGVTAFLAALGFFSNRWTLSRLKAAPSGAKRRRKTQRVVAVSLTLIFTLVTAIAGVLAFMGI